jgi:hypothetical protein
VFAPVWWADSTVGVEGYLLYDCRATFDQQLTAKHHRVCHMLADHGTYSQVGSRPLTIEQVAQLPQEASPHAPTAAASVNLP